MAKKVKRILFNATFFDSGRPKWETGKHYPDTEETRRQIKIGIAEEIEVDAAAAEQADLELAPVSDKEAKNAEPAA